MKGATLCSGIGAPECAAPDIDWIWSSDIEPFPNAVRAVRFPDSVNLGDMTAEDFIERAAAIGLPDVLVAGTPCQAFSVAGLRNSLADDRGNLTLLFVRICDAIDDLRRNAGLDPLWIVWENVPGVLSVDDNAFGTLLAGLGGHDAAITTPDGGRWPNAGMVAGPRRGVAWRVLDAQYFGVAQRRRRIFCVARGDAGNWHAAEALLPIIDRLQWHPAPRREAGKDVAGSLTSRASGGGGGPGAGTDEACAGYLQAVAPTLDAHMDRKWGSNQWVNNGFAIMSSGQANAKVRIDGGAPSLTCLHEAPIISYPAAFAQNTRDEIRLIGGDGQIAGALTAGAGTKQTTYIADVARSLTARHDGSPCDDRGPNIVATPINTQLGLRGPDSANTSREGVGIGDPGDPAYTLQSAHSHAVAVTHTLTTRCGQVTETGDGRGAPLVAEAFQSSQSGVRTGDIHATLDANNGSRRHNGAVVGSQVRRLTPRECERLQGFPDDWTAISVRGRPAPDAPRYKALGNSMAVPVMRYILDRVQEINDVGR